ncbi:hypothetical protein FisN_13Lh286 [Fistulifera solaris]|uniref:STAS domain-containing protein n=1 Tax=Fistulifera solaris TaxID=1519565 RepID=A0A1Z5KM07_FISSO|nr:hypothetical protein FisN_13Lh286 [Fistulifera solaris]|eukprot:GAX27165.1 hypothetical protein FisN_13Lh286 [Fistulifera solaris]
MNERTGLLPTATKNDRTLTSLFEHPGHGAAIRPEEEEEEEEIEGDSRSHSFSASISYQDLSGTCVGSFVFVLYHVVFCLAQAAAVPGHTGVLAKVAALGTVTAGTSFIFRVNIPALYPATDLFLAPFLAKMAESIQDVLQTKGGHDDDTLFLNTLLAVTGFGLFLSGSLSILAARWKLANWGAYLPYSVLCGFFTTIGILMWTLGFAVDTGQKIGSVVTSNDRKVIQNAFLHHFPSVVVGSGMHYAGRQHPYWVLFCIFMTVIIFYTILWTTGTSIAQAQEAQWLFSPKELQTPPREAYGPPLPFGTMVAAWNGVIDWDAFQATLPTVVALAFLYVIRCSLHASALFKNKRLLVRRNEHSDDVPVATARPRRNQSPRLTLGAILEQGYGYSQLVAAWIGGITVAPSVAASLTLFQLNAEKPAPQFGSNLLLLAFYLSDFQLVQYIPKTAFSCLMVLAGIDMCRTWLIGSFFKTNDKLEWAVAPLLVILSFSVGMLYAILMGIAASAFLFVANFQKAGTVRFVGSGLSLQSTVERTPREVTWLEQNNYLTQILMLQNFLFFGNAQSILSYVSTMFEDDELQSDLNGRSELDSVTPSFVPEFIIVDFSMVSGMDTSAVDLFHEIVALCRDHDCTLFLSGTTVHLRSFLAGIRGLHVRFMTDLETALAKAEDGLLSRIFPLEIEPRSTRDGFVNALHKLEELHSLPTVTALEALRDYTSLVELVPGDVLVRDEGGIYCVETGVLKRTALNQTTWQPSWRHRNIHPPTIGQFHASNRRMTDLEKSFRVARVGPGWIIGGMEEEERGDYEAMTPCRLHHLPLSVMRTLEQSHPTLSIQLYKLLSFLNAKRQETTIQHLDQLVRILNGNTPRWE